jgi:hypothetical protein
MLAPITIRATVALKLPGTAKQLIHVPTIRGWTPTSLAIDRVLRPAAAKRTIRARFKSRHRGAANGFKYIAIFPRKVDFSCFGYHPDVES